MARWSFDFNLPRKVVNFKCRVPNNKNHIVCLVGSGEELGNWNPREAVILRYDEVSQLWSRKITLKSPEMYRYRYFVCRLLWEEEHNRTSTIQSLKEAAGIIILFWESNIVSRMIHTRVLPEYYELPVVDFAIRAYHYTEWTRGWVYNGREIRIRLSGKDSIQLLSGAELTSNIRIKCVPLNFQEMTKMNTVPAKLRCSKQLIPMLTRFLNACDMPVCYFDPNICGKSGFSDGNCKLSRTYTVSDVVVSKLDGVHYVPGLQESRGISYTRDDLISFTISTSLKAALGFRVELLQSNRVRDQLVGYSYILPLVKCRSVLKVPVYSCDNKEEGTLTLDCLLITPVSDLHLDMQTSFQNHWNWGHYKKSSDFIDSGFSEECLYKQIGRVSKNTLNSLLVASKQNVHYLHFEVVLTKEKIPVVFNNFVAHVTFLNRNSELEFYQMNIKDLTVDQLRRLQLSSVYEEAHPQTKGRIQNEMIPFPSLALCLAIVSKEIGFIIQVKYPSRDNNGRPEIADYFDEDTVVNSIINIVFNDYDQRKIIFTSPQCDICILLQKKQNRFPVLLQVQEEMCLRQHQNDILKLLYEQMSRDNQLRQRLLSVHKVEFHCSQSQKFQLFWCRSPLGAYHRARWMSKKAISTSQDGCYDFRSLDTILEFVVAEKLLGVYLPSVEVTRDKNLVAKVHKLGLVLFAGGPGSCSPDIRKLLCRSRVNGLETCHVDFDVEPGFDHPHYYLPTAHVNMLYIADIVLKKGLMRLPRCSIADSSNCDYRHSLVPSNEMEPHESRLTF